MIAFLVSTIVGPSVLHITGSDEFESLIYPATDLDKFEFLIYPAWYVNTVGPGSRRPFSRQLYSLPA
jgi:hypothetical protein